MSLFSDKTRSAILRKLVKQVPDEQIDLAKNLFANAPGADLEAFDIDTLVQGADMASKGLAAFTLKKPLVKIEGPCLQIINRDVPFILDSVLDEINQRGLMADLVLHPVFEKNDEKVSLVQIHFNALSSDQAKALKQGVVETIKDVNSVVNE